MKDSAELAKQLKNVGHNLAAKMIEAKIDSPDKLRKLGAKKAYELMYKNGDKYGDFNAAYLYALEGAIRDCNLHDLPASVKAEFRDFAQSLQSNKKTDNSDSE